VTAPRFRMEQRWKYGLGSRAVPHKGRRSIPTAALQQWPSVTAAWSRRGTVPAPLCCWATTPGCWPAAGSWTGLAFLPNGNDLLAMDSAAQSLALIQDVQNTAVSSVVLSVSQKPGALAVSSDGSEAALGLADSVTVVNLAGGAATSIACSCQTARFDLLEGNLVARIIDGQTGSQFLLDADSAQPRIGSLPELNLGVAQ